LIKAKKKFGQNFLKDERYVHRIIESMPQDKTQIVEIGPGLGDLTEKLLDIGNVIAFEIDNELCQTLRVKFDREVREGQLQLRCIDALEARRQGEFVNKPYHLIANLPYYVATTMILDALKDPLCRTILVMVQLEVAEKFCATAGEKAFSSLSVLASHCGERELLFHVPPEAFDPAPKVTSAVFRIRKRENATYSDDLANLLRVAFAQPRKRLAKNLSTHYAKNRITTVFEELEIGENTRPHEISTSTYEHLLAKL